MRLHRRFLGLKVTLNDDKKISNLLAEKEADPEIPIKDRAHALPHAVPRLLRQVPPVGGVQ
jgi:hypothetical protein